MLNIGEKHILVFQTTDGKNAYCPPNLTFSKEFQLKSRCVKPYALILHTTLPLYLVGRKPDRKTTSMEENLTGR